MASPDELVAILHERRKAMGVSQAQLAKDIGTGQSHICEIERGYVKPSLRTLVRWADRLGMDVAVVARQEGDTPSTPVPRAP